MLLLRHRKQDRRAAQAAGAAEHRLKQTVAHHQRAAIGCENPQVRFRIDTAIVKSETLSARSLVIGCWNRPKLCRMPRLKLR